MRVAKLEVLAWGGEKAFSCLHGAKLYVLARVKLVACSEQDFYVFVWDKDFRCLHGVRLLSHYK